MPSTALGQQHGTELIDGGMERKEGGREGRKEEGREGGLDG